MRGLYIHIPFCKQICNYCDFPKRIARNQQQIDDYLDHVIAEIDKYTSYYPSVKTIYIGGGTPNILSIIQMRRLLEKIASLQIQPLEYTVECNPELINEEYASLFKEFNITRISLGVQTFNNEDLVKLNRHHREIDAINSIELLRHHGIKNINIDLIFAHPFDSMEKIKYNLELCQSLKVDHISYYSMILEDKTVFKHQHELGMLSLIDDDVAAEMYEYIMTYLKNNGYHHYETSNFALPGHESIHNQLYWKEMEYVGVGAGAAGFLDRIRYTNSSKLFEYYKGIQTIEKLSKLDIKKEYMMLGFRLIDGISIDDYQKRFNSLPSDDFNIKKLIDEELIKEEEKFLRLTEKGIMLANEVFMEFV